MSEPITLWKGNKQMVIHAPSLAAAMRKQGWTDEPTQFADPKQPKRSSGKAGSKGKVTEGEPEVTEGEPEVTEGEPEVTEGEPEGTE